MASLDRDSTFDETDSLLDRTEFGEQIQAPCEDTSEMRTTNGSKKN